jgi:hypothetical protein
MKLVRKMIIADVLLGIIFIVINLTYAYFGIKPMHNVVWSPLWLTFYNISPAADDVGSMEPNFSFYYFWLILAINIYFLIKLNKTNN